MQTVGQIIRQRREALGMTLTALATAVGSTKSYLSMIENHKVPNPPSRQVLEQLEKALAITDGQLRRAADWENTPQAVRVRLAELERQAQQARHLAQTIEASTRSPRGHVGRGTAPRDLDKMVREIHKALKDAARAGGLADRPAADPAIDLRGPVLYRIPLINKVAAGYPQDFTDLDYPVRVADEYVSAPDLSDPHAFAARVVGDSMDPEYREGDVVIFSPAAKVADGADCFVRLAPDHQTTFKRVYFEDGGVRLQPLNPKFPPQVVPREEVTGLYRAVARYQKLG